MICMGEAGMKRVLFKVILPLLVIAAWMNMCYWICIRADGFDFFLYWIMIGCPYGIRKMCMFIGVLVEKITCKGIRPVPNKNM